MKTKIYIVIATLLIVVSCQKETKNEIIEPMGSEEIIVRDSVPPPDWTIPFGEVFDGGPGKDGIPAIDNPEFISVAEASYLKDEDLVLGYINGDQIRAYPHAILNWHEIINDDIGDVSMAVVYCPLTGTGIGWNRILTEGKTTYGVSGQLYNSNIIPYDRLTNSNWSQMLLKSVNGELVNRKSDNIFLLETTWETWKKMYPGTQVISENTGYSRNYTTYPYGNYRTSDALIFPVSNSDNRLARKERVLGVIIEDKAKTYSIKVFSNDVSVFSDSFKGNRLVITGSKKSNFIVAYNRVLDDGTELEFTAVQNAFPIIMEDNEGSRWDAFGKAVSGPRQGTKLKTVTQMMGYWFAWVAFYPDLENYRF